MLAERLTPLLYRYGIALVAVIGALATKLLLDPLIESSTPFLLFLVAVMFSAWQGGLGPGLFATALSALAADFIFLAPVRSLLISTPGQVIWLGAFVLEGIVISLLSGALHEARDVAEKSSLQLERLQTVTDTALAHLALDDLLHQLLDRICEVLQADAAVILLLSPRGDSLSIRAAKDVSGPVHAEATIPLDRGISGAIATRRESVILEEVDHDELLVPVFQERAVRSLLGTPLIVEGRVIGVVQVGTVEPRRFTEADQLLLQRVADRAALAIDRSRLYEEAREAIAVRDAFFSVASHEIKTPLTALSGYAGLLLRRVEERLEPRDAKAVRTIYEQSERLNKLIDLLFDLSRIQTGNFTVERAPLDLNALTRRVVETIGAPLETHSLVLAAPDEPVIVEGDDVRLEQVLNNLLRNAIKYSPEGGVVAVGLERENGEARLTVADHGIGIPTDALPHLFSPFYRARNARTYRIKGAGWGLAVVQEIVARHGGDIQVESSEGEGSTFTISLPCLSASEA